MRSIFLLLLSALSLPLLPAGARAEEGMTMFMRNQNDRAIVVEFHGRTTGAVWPGKGQIYLLDGKEKKSVTLGCVEGERICYGAWVNGNDRQSFGVGPDDDRDCDDCCRTCVGGTTETVDIGG